MLEIEKISESHFENIQDLELDSLGSSQREKRSRKDNRDYYSYDSIEEGGGRSPNRQRSWCGRRYRSDVQIDGCGMRTSPACSSDCNSVVAGNVACACQCAFTRGLDAGVAEVA